MFNSWHVAVVFLCPGLTCIVVSGFQRLLAAGSCLEQFSPLSFEEEELEREFLAVQRSNGADLASLHFLSVLGFACLMARMLPPPELPRAAAMCVVPLLGLALKFASPTSFHAHVQVQAC